LTARFWAVDLADAAARDAPHADRRVEIDGPGGDRLHPDLLVRPQPHDRTLAVALLDLRDGQIQRFLLVVLQGRHSHALILAVSRPLGAPISVIVAGNTGALDTRRKYETGRPNSSGIAQRERVGHVAHSHAVSLHEHPDDVEAVGIVRATVTVD